MFQSMEEAREFFKDDKFAMANGMVIDEIGEDYAECSMHIASIHKNANGTVMGGVYFTLADFAFAVMVNHIHKVSVGMDSNITFHTPAKGKRLTARAQLIKTGKTTSFCEVIVTDDFDRRCATFTGTAFKL